MERRHEHEETSARARARLARLRRTVRGGTLRGGRRPELAEAGDLEQRNQELIAGAVERIALTFERMASRLAGTAELDTPAANTPGSR